MKLELPKKYYNLSELEERWDGYEITEDQILQMAAVGQAVLHVWFDGTVISLKKDGTRFKQTYYNLAKLPLEEAQKFLIEVGTSPKNLLGKDGEKLSVLQINKYEGIYWRSDLCMLPEEVKRLDAEFSRLEAEQSENSRQQSTLQAFIPPKAKSSGKPKSSLTEAVEYLYDICMQEGDSEILQPGNINQFILKLQEIKKSPPSTSANFIFDNIKYVKKVSAKWTIRTEDRIVKDSNTKETTMKSKSYGQNDVSKILTRLRK